MRDFPDLRAPEMPPGHELLAEGRALARAWRLGESRFMQARQVASEAEWKRRCAAEGRIMQHAHIGFRNLERTLGAMRDLGAAAEGEGFTIDRFGITLDWTMGYPPEHRAGATRGTGIVLAGPEDFARITGASDSAAHFGDFMLGLPGALHNTQAAIAAGATAIGNLGQYFTFRLPGWDDDVATTRATVTALGLIAAQDAEILVHSNLDDGFAGLFRDMASALGMAMIERHIVEDLIGAKLAFCFGHHFSEPLTRMAFQAALARVTDSPGTMIFGNTVSYRGTAAANYASLARYLMADMVALARAPSGHAVNPVPVTENLRIPDTDEILDAQRFAARLAELVPGQALVSDAAPVEAMAARLVEAGRGFAARALAGLEERGVDTADPAALMLAIRRLGARRMEALWGAGALQEGQRRPLVPADWAEELDEMAADWAGRWAGRLDLAGRRLVIGTTDVHEHGAYLVSAALRKLGAQVIEAGVAVDAPVLVEAALREEAEAIAISTYNGIALSYLRQVKAALAAQGRDLPVLIGGKLNAIPDDSNSGLPVDVTARLREEGALTCAGLDDMIPLLRQLAAEADRV